MNHIWKYMIYLNWCAISVTIVAFIRFGTINWLIEWSNDLISDAYRNSVALDRHYAGQFIILVSFITYLIFSRFFDNLESTIKERYRPLKTIYYIHLGALLSFLFVGMIPLFLFETDWVWGLLLLILAFSTMLLNMTVIVDTVIQRFRPAVAVAPVNGMSRTQL